MEKQLKDKLKEWTDVGREELYVLGVLRLSWNVDSLDTANIQRDILNPSSET